MERGRITSWDDMIIFWQYIYKDMNLDPRSLPVMLSTSPTAPRRETERTSEIFFEDFQVPALWLANQAVMALLGTGRITGTILDSGYGVTHAVPIYQGSVVQHGIRRWEYAGVDIAQRLQDYVLREHGYRPTRDTLRELVWLRTYVAEDFDAEMERGGSMERPFALPDGNVLSVGNERYGPVSIQEVINGTVW